VAPPWPHVTLNKDLAERGINFKAKGMITYAIDRAENEKYMYVKQLELV
jgi:hypothetical protein